MIKLINKGFLERTFPLDSVKFAFTLQHIKRGYEYKVTTYID